MYIFSFKSFLEYFLIGLITTLGLLGFVGLLYLGMLFFHQVLGQDEGASYLLSMGWLLVVFFVCVGTFEHKHDERQDELRKKIRGL